LRLHTGSICDHGCVASDRKEPVRDVLAAEEFAMPAPDPAIHHAPVRLPSDLTGDEAPRDVLAAEEFAMPAGPPHPLGRAEDAGSYRGRFVRLAVGGALALFALRALRRR
jgi:hypothetical protein